MYPHVTTGFSDSNAYLRELTLKSMLVLAPKLTQRTLNQSLLKFLAKLQVGLPASCCAALSHVPEWHSPAVAGTRCGSMESAASVARVARNMQHRSNHCMAAAALD